ncbi:PQQ-binding-like beta-propeller repeat protein [bacterium]|nr:PQQ-binding-like beta-propeller repeat protein [bacterium]
MKSTYAYFAIAGSALVGMTIAGLLPDQKANAEEAQAVAKTDTAKPDSPKDWRQWGGSSARNNTPDAKNVPTTWDVGGFDRSTGAWEKENSVNIKWVAPLGSQSYGNPVVCNGKIFVGTNNGGGYIDRYPSKVDLGCLLCFDEKTGELLWQHSSEKLPTGRVHDWPLQGICSAVYAEGNKLWFVTSRGEVRCLDAEGFRDGENDGPVTNEEFTGDKEADVIWIYDMMKELGVSQHNMCNCSVTALGDILFVNTSNGVDESHIVIPSTEAPSFIAMDKNTGEVLWTDKSPGSNILHGQWSSPTVATLGDVPQVLFAGGDGWLYSFKADKGKDGKPELLWKFDANPKTSKWVLGGRGTRNNIIATPVVYNDHVYVAVGQDPEHGEGEGHLWCIDPTKRGDVSAELAMKIEGSQRVPIKHQRIQAVVEEDGQVAVPNPNSAVVWHYSTFDQNGNGKIDFEETMHRSIGTTTIKDDLLYIADFSGLLHCLDAKTGKPHWTYDMFAAAWGSALIADGHVYIGDEDGDVAVFKLSGNPDDAEPIEEINMGNSVYSTPIVANGVLYIANKTHLFAIEVPKADK